MATIAPTYAYTTGATLDINGHNANIYSETSGRSILGEVNGNLNINNFSGGAFAVRDYLVRPEEAVRVRSDYARDSVDYFSEAESGPDVADENAREELINVAGCGLRFWIPYAAVVVWNMGFFVNIFRIHRGRNGNGEDTTDDSFGDIRIQLSVGIDSGTPSVIQESKRGLPVSAELNTVSPFSLTNYEEVGSFYIDLHHTSRTTGAGWVDLHLRLLLTEPADGLADSVLRTLPKDIAGAARNTTADHQIHNRVSFGIRHPVALVLKSS